MLDIEGLNNEVSYIQIKYIYIYISTQRIRLNTTTDSQNSQDFHPRVGNQSEFKIMIYRWAVRQSPSSANLWGTSFPAHIFYISKSAVKLFQLVLEHCSGHTNLLMKEPSEPIKPLQNLTAVICYTYSFECFKGVRLSCFIDYPSV